MHKASIRIKPSAFVILAASILGIQATANAGKFDDVIEAFEDNGDYVQPMATLFGSMTNSGWYQSAGVARKFGFYLGLPTTLVGISDDDRSYKATFTDDGCQLYHQDSPGGTACQDQVGYTAPTILGREKSKPNKRSVYDPNSKTFGTPMEIPVSDGLADIADFNWLPFVMPQLSFGLFHTELKLRYLILPLGDFSFNTLGLGLQHDLGSFLPPLPVSISLAGNFTTMGAEFSPGGDIKGTLELDGVSHFIGLLVGYNLLGFSEVFVEAGWEGASIHSGGNLTITDPDGVVADEIVKPDLTVDGRNGFRMALNLAVHFGYQAVVGQNVGANMGQQVSLGGFRLKL